MENFNKENLFNELQEKFPMGMKVFCEWIDEYKKKNDWHKLFNFGSPHYAKQGWHDPKFHDLPKAMQVGIWIEFVCNRGGCQWEIEDLFSHDFREDICKYIEMIHEDELISK